MAALAYAQAAWSASLVTGTVTDPQGRAVEGAAVTLARRVAATDASGQFAFPGVDAGTYRITAEARGFPAIARTVTVAEGTAHIDLQFAAVAAQGQSVTVSATVSTADPSERVLLREDTLDANPGRPGMPVSIPGMPVESPAGGIKPPQYFVPGVAGDHGEPIAMFFQVGGFLFPNNLPVNAHGNGYADPNVIMPLAIEAVATDGGAFNVREGNNSVNAAMAFSLRDRVEPMARLTVDSRDANLVSAWSPSNRANKAWAGFEISYGNGFLRRLEHRRQYKGNLAKAATLGEHRITVFGTGYYGFAYQPGLIPIDVPVPGDTIDGRQREETSNGALIVNDIWRNFQFSAYYRYYTLDVRPNFGDGLIRQSEHRNSNAEDVLYTRRFTTAFSILAGADARREAPRALDLDRAGLSGVFQPLTANNITIDFYSPFVAADGTFARYFHYNAGYRADRVTMRNRDLYRPADSFSRNATVHSPKGTLTFRAPGGAAPEISLSYGQAFHVDDPRIGTTAAYGGTIAAKARSYQLVATQTVSHTEFRVTLAHVTTAQQLARIDNDTGLQEDVGPSLMRSVTASARRRLAHGFLEALFARADARDRVTGLATPEAPRMLWSLVASLDRLPLGLEIRGEYEDVARKPLGDGFNAVPVREFRGALVRPFPKRGIDVGVNVFVASGYGGQTLETLALAGENAPVERIVGFPLRNYVTASFTYRFRRSATHF